MRKTKKPEIEPLEIMPQVQAYVAKQLSLHNVMTLIEAAASCAIEGNKLADQLLSTLNRIVKGQPVGERFLLQLAWYLRNSEDSENERPPADVH